MLTFARSTNNYMSKSKYFFVILILGSLTALAPFSIDMYLPGFPAIALDLKTSAAKVSLSLTGFFIGISAGQLLYGPLLDRFGRKKPLCIGLVVYILASIGCAYAHSINSLIVLRLVQALGSCAATVTAVAMVRDLFPVKDSPKVFSLLILVLGASPMIAPTAGGYLTAAFGWHSVFIVLTALGILVLLASVFFLPDVYKPDTTLSLKPLPIINNFLSVIKEPQFYTYALTGALAFAGLFAYVSGSPLIFMNVFGLSDKVYGWIFAFLSIGFIGSSQLNTLLLRKFTSEKIVSTVLVLYSIFGIAFFIITLLGWLTLPITIVFLFLILSMVGITNPNAASLSLAPFAKNAGSASALMGAIQMGLGAFISFLISLKDEPSALPLAAAMAGSGVLALIMLITGRKNIINKTSVSVPETFIAH
jgi:DHA1 family bicyclomycin/chloramphenicol resistance-like MFS transporter